MEFHLLRISPGNCYVGLICVTENAFLKKIDCYVIHTVCVIVIVNNINECVVHNNFNFNISITFQFVLISH